MLHGAALEKGLREIEAMMVLFTGTWLESERLVLCILNLITFLVPEKWGFMFYFKSAIFYL
jgi:hypothetical protein